MDKNQTSDKRKSEEKNSHTMNISISAGNDKIKYYDCSENNCIFEIIDLNQNKDQRSNQVEENVVNEKVRDGKITIVSLINCGEDEYLQGVKVNLYKINGLSPILIDSKVTNEKGKITFCNLSEGCYRIIELVDKRYFEKPKYVNWNEIIIDGINKEQKVKIINKVKRFKAINKYR